MRSFELFEPTSLKEASTLLEEWGNKGMVLAGGTDLLVWLKENKISPDALISLRCVPHIDTIRQENGAMILGSCTTLRTIEKSALIRKFFLALKNAADHFGSIQVRNIATIGGNVCTASPSGDAIPPLMIHDAQLTIFHSDYERKVRLADFILGPGKTELGKGEILKNISLSLIKENTTSVYLKLTRRAEMELPLIGVAARISFDSSGTIVEGGIAVACAGPTCFRAREAESLLPGEKISKRFLEEIGMAVLEESNARDSLRCSKKYREEMIPVLVARSIQQCHTELFSGEGVSA